MAKQDFEPLLSSTIMRVVSLVPSLTQTLFDLGLSSTEVVGRTPWCIHPAPQVNDVMIVGGTKTPNLGKIRALKPDLIVMDREENPLKVYQTLFDEGFEIFVSSVESPSDVPDMLRALGAACDRNFAGEQLALLCEDSIQGINRNNPALRTIPLIWQDPLMAVSPTRYAGAILSEVGFEVIDTHPNGNGYPEVTVEDFIKHKIELILLTSEPHKFTLAEGNEIVEQISSAGGIPPRVEFIDGEDLTWFGTRTAPAIARLVEFRKKIEDSN